MCDNYYFQNLPVGPPVLGRPQFSISVFNLIPRRHQREINRFVSETKQLNPWDTRTLLKTTFKFKPKNIILGNVSGCTL
jgi:hypothetical protein